MAVCDAHKSCILFNNELKGMPITVQMMKLKYCNDNFLECLCFACSQELPN